MDFTEDELLVIEAMLVGAMEQHNDLIAKGHYFSKGQKEMFDIIKGMLNKLEDAEGEQ